MEQFAYASMRATCDISKYLVVGPSDCAGRDLSDVVREALAGGITFVQLRDKGADVSTLVREVREIADVIRESSREQEVAFVIDDRVDAAVQARAEGIKVDGVHVGQDDLDPVLARRLLGRDAIVGLSAKTAEDVARANALPFGTVDYLGAGPLHKTATKPDCIVVDADGSQHTLDTERINALCDATELPVIVGGGVHESDLPLLASTHAAGWFVVSAIAGAHDPQRAARALVDGWDKLRGGTVPEHPAAELRETTLPAAITVATTDSSGGAGVPVDIKTMMACGVFAECAVAAITAQNTTGVTLIEELSPEAITAQIDAVFADIRPAAVKIGMVPSIAGITAVADALEANHADNIVADPVMVATSGAKLINDDAIEALVTRLFPMATVITPNIPETRVLLSAIGEPMDIATEHDMEEAGKRLARKFGCAVLVKGGHGTQDASDALVCADGSVTWFRGERIANPNTHGTGCTLSSAIAAFLAQGETLEQAIGHAKRYLTGALRQMLNLGAGSGPFDHAWMWR
ncbi:Phosphomethylpyrimidine kinase [Bifidobacterium magnum]|uniref:Thiamine-phosphate synthase n=1 Tax=Bifidobacterium magnum TaxID=1692 RepID=A0A087BDS7_9BIFI|nr:bifunctional hydroxymethylpyrimidine kinase/phosphomethylpyrimidine kinase [Bifidobacterium magnum]KFI69177.1 Phosphomethylpyrimidine kinase [Bifidobacterium magnum]